jgi:hypothetical protein
MLESSPELIPVDEQSNDQIVHMFCFGKADCAAYETLDPRAQGDVLALDALPVFLPHDVFLSSHMTLIG